MQMNALRFLVIGFQIKQFANKCRVRFIFLFYQPFVFFSSSIVGTNFDINDVHRKFGEVWARGPRTVWWGGE